MGGGASEMPSESEKVRSWSMNSCASCVFASRLICERTGAAANDHEMTQMHHKVDTPPLAGPTVTRVEDQ